MPKELFDKESDHYTLEQMVYIAVNQIGRIADAIETQNEAYLENLELAKKNSMEETSELDVPGSKVPTPEKEVAPVPEGESEE